MSDRTDRGEAAATRRRWLTVGEIVAVLAVGISAASLWDSHQQRVEDRAIVERAKAVPRVPLLLTATARDDGALLRLAADGNRIIQTQTISFPAALRLEPVETTGNARIEAGWFAAALRRALPGARPRGRLPVAIVTRYTDNGVIHEDSAIYDIGHGWRDRLLQPDVPVLEGISLVARGREGLQARLDARWQRSHPAGG